MNSSPNTVSRRPYCAAILLFSRVVVGVMFGYLGMVKVLDPVAFLKVLREYDITSNFLALNFIAGVLPWLEVLCAICLIAGIGVRGVGALLAVMLVGFTAALISRAIGIQHETGMAICAIEFDCGCGGGPVPLCRKLVENAILFGLCCLVTLGSSHRWCLRSTLLVGGKNR